MTESPVELELRLLEPSVRASFADLERLLADDFLEFGSSGAIYDKASMINALLSPHVADAGHRRAVDMEIVELATDVVLLRYRSVYANPEGHVVRQALRSSIWRLADGRWQMAFHQGTLIP